MVQGHEKTKTTGLVIGKFMPPHIGHQYLVDFATNYADKLTVLVCSLKNEPIPGELRYAWMKEMFPNADVKHCTDENPAYPEEDPEFWSIWKTTINKYVPNGANYLFASERYGEKLAEVIGAKFIPTPDDRSIIDVSATKIRKEPMKNWSYIPDIVKPYYVKNVCVFGPESTGKSTLTKKLAKQFRTVYAPEFARTLLEIKGGQCNYEDIDLIAKGQIASQKALAKKANKVLISDTDVLTTQIWSELLFKKCPNWIKEEAKKQTINLYLVMDTDVPFVKDAQRYGGDKRQLSFEICVKELKKHDKKFVIISGDFDERFRKATEEINRLLEEELRWKEE